jgi:hypothetical protein
VEKELAKRRKFIDDQKRKSVLGHAARWGKEMPVGAHVACPKVCPDDAPPSPSPDQDQDQLPFSTARGEKPPVPPHSETEEIYFSRIDVFFKALTDGNLDEWGKAYPAIPLEVELQRARMWLKANPAKRKKNLQRFVVNWLAHAQESGGMSYGRRTERHDGESRTAGVREKYAGR